MQNPQNLSQPIRRHDIDWLRVILFALLIWFHYAVFSLGQLEGEDSSMELFNLSLFIIICNLNYFRILTFATRYF